jgi:WD40 repeat protein
MLTKGIALTVIVIFCLLGSVRANNKSAEKVQEEPLSEQHINVPMKKISVSGKDNISNIAWSPDSQYIATIAESGHLRIFDTKGNSILDECVAPGGRGLKFSPDGNLLSYITITHPHNNL